MKIKFFIFFMFHYFLIIFNCVCHSRSRHTNFSRPCWDHHSTLFLSNFSGNDFCFSCECWFNSHASIFRPQGIQLETGGKPSTWFPPGELVELSMNKNITRKNFKIKFLFHFLYVFQKQCNTFMFLL